MTIEVPKIVTVDRCHVAPSPLPEMMPTAADAAACAAAFGAGAVCFGPGDAWRLAALLEALAETWRAVKACEEAVN